MKLAAEEMRQEDVVSYVGTIAAAAERTSSSIAQQGNFCAKSDRDAV
jgi:hypothetical protein